MPVGRTNRRAFIAALGGVAALTLAAQAQQPSKVRKVGFLYPGPLAGAPPRIAAVVSGLRAGGFREPEDAQILARITEGDASKLAPMAADLIGQGVDLIIAVGPAAVRAVRAATSTIPIVASDLESDPVKAGFVASVARPGGNLTGTFLAAVHESACGTSRQLRHRSTAVAFGTKRKLGVTLPGNPPIFLSSCTAQGSDRQPVSPFAASDLMRVFDREAGAGC